ncbi:MAG: helix-turn-helix domain-containing protein [Xanthobacteraceae bacterium]
MDRIAYTLPEAARIAGVSRTRIFEAVRKQELTVRKAGRASIVTHDDLVAWIKSLPARGKHQNLCLPRDGRSA